VLSSTDDNNHNDANEHEHEHELALLQHEQQCMLERIKQWEAETEARLEALDDGAHGGEARQSHHLLTMLMFEISICYWSCFYALDNSPQRWQTNKAECLQILDNAARTISRLTSETDYESLASDGLLIGLLQLARECRDWTVRSRALHLSKRLVSSRSTWHTMSLVLGVTACVMAEEQARDPVAGLIPPEEQYAWTSGCWNHDHTELHVGLTSKGVNEAGVLNRRLVVLCPGQELNIR
jgi:hypothetical protein